MLGRIWAVYSVELTKALRTPSVFIGPVLVVMVAAGLVTAHLGSEEGAAAYKYIAVATPLALNTAGFLMILVFSAGLVSSEIGQGTIRQVLVRPVLRHEFLFGKLLMGITYAVALELLVAATSWGSAACVGQLRGVTYGGELLHTAGEMVQAYALGALLASAPLAAGVAFALFLSTLAKNSASSIGAALAIWVLADTLKLAFGVEALVFTSYLGVPWEVFARRCEAIDASWFPMATHCLVVSSITFFGAVAAAVAVIRSRNLG